MGARLMASPFLVHLTNQWAFRLFILAWRANRADLPAADFSSFIT
jgi:hypothetical protein